MVVVQSSLVRRSFLYNWLGLNLEKPVERKTSEDGRWAGKNSYRVRDDQPAPSSEPEWPGLLLFLRIGEFVGSSGTVKSGREEFSFARPIRVKSRREEYRSPE